jgi:hypothetical protein
MTVDAWNWVLATVGTIASIAGVVFSSLAWVQASKAKDAAREATNAVRKRNAALEFQRLAGDARLFLDAVRQSRGENAVSAGTSLVQGLAMIREREITRTSDIRTLKNCENEIMGITVSLNVDGVPSDRSKLSDLLDRSHAIHRTISELAGRMERLSEGVAL